MLHHLSQNICHLLSAKMGHQSELAGLETPHPSILPGQLPELTHSVSCYGDTQRIWATQS